LDAAENTAKSKGNQWFPFDPSLKETNGFLLILPSIFVIMNPASLGSHENLDENSNRYNSHLVVGCFHFENENKVFY
jgi:hypothetical protein